MNKKQPFALWQNLAVSCLLLSAQAAYVDISGAVFLDYNLDGHLDSTARCNSTFSFYC